MSFAFDHAIIAVGALEPAIEHFKALGFSAFYGGQHADGKTHNGLVVFEDGGYLELLAPVDVDFMASLDTVDLSSFLDFVAKGDGWAGYALQVEDIDAAAQAMRDRQLSVTGPTANGRTRPDGTELAWRTIAIDNTRTPFFITDETPRVLRVPDDADKVTHANGVTGVESMIVAVQNLGKSSDYYRAMLGVEPRNGPPVADAGTASFTLAGFTLTLAAPSVQDSPLYDYLKQRGEVPYEIRLRTNQPQPAGLLDVERTHEARIVLV